MVDTQIDPDQRHEDEVFVLPRYDLTQEELDVLEADIIANVREQTEAEYAAAWVSPQSRFANFFRTNEVMWFPEANDVDSYYDNHQNYLALVDLRDEGKVVQAASIMNFDDQKGDRTGFYTIDSLIARGNFTKDEFVDYCQSQGIDLPHSISIETNFKIKKYERSEPYNGFRRADLTYISIVNWLIDQGAPREGTTVFASMNEDQTRSLDNGGFTHTPLLGRSDFNTEESDEGKESHPVEIDYANAHDIITAFQLRLPAAQLD